MCVLLPLRAGHLEDAMGTDVADLSTHFPTDVDTVIEIENCPSVEIPEIVQGYHKEH